MNNPHNLKVGQTVVVVNKSKIIEQAKIRSIGQKYFYIEGGRLRFDIETLWEYSPKYVPQIRVYPSLSLYELEQRKKELRNTVREFANSNIDKLKVEQLERIIEIIKEK